MTSLTDEVQSFEKGEEIACRVIDGSLIQGQVLRVQRDQAGVHIEICPFDRSEPQYRIQILRTSTGWRKPYLERRGINDEDWNRYAEVVDFE